MTPHELGPYRERLDAAIARLGWKLVYVRREHEREWNCSWREWILCGPDGEYLMDESDLSEGMAKQIIRIAGMSADTISAAQNDGKGTLMALGPVDGFDSFGRPQG